MSDIPRWFSETKDGHSSWYVERFRTMARDGVDLAGEARLIDAMVGPAARILDAGCGPGRVGGELFRRGHDVVGVDVDPELIAAAREDYPGPAWLVGNLAELDTVEGLGEPFDVAVVAGNVFHFVAPGTERAVLSRLRQRVREGGAIVVGFRLDRPYTLADFDADVEAAGMTVEQRFATWDLKPFTADADFHVTILRT